MTQQEFQKELLFRIEQVEQGIPGVKRMRKKDYIEVGVLVVICLTGMIIGAFL